MSVDNPTSTQYFGRVCVKHPEYLGLRRKCNGACQKCATEKATKRHRSKVKTSGVTQYVGAVCEKHPEKLGLRRKINGGCVGCHNKSMMKKVMSKRKTSPLHNLKHRVATRIQLFLKKRGYSKKSKTAKMLGCDWDTLVAHLSRQFTDGMSMDNRHFWHIDHIVPLASAKTENELFRLCHYTNLQPLWAEDNIAKSDTLVVDSK